MSHAVGDVIRANPKLHGWARTVKRAQRHAFEHLGSDHYSRPAYDDLDRKLAAYLPGRGGTFVEAGAYDGYWGSNTYWFERFRGWNGVLIEPVPELADRARGERPRSQVFQCALVAPEYRDTHITLLFGENMTVVEGVWSGDEEQHARAGAGMNRRETFKLEVPARVLSDVLDEASIGEIDLITLDVEGYVVSVLRGLDLTRHGPRFLLVEMLREEEERPAIEATLADGYDHEARLSGRDHLYRRLS
jgi:FkbM family methyltransferase